MAGLRLQASKKASERPEGRPQPVVEIAHACLLPGTERPLCEGPRFQVPLGATLAVKDGQGKEIIHNEVVFDALFKGLLLRGRWNQRPTRAA